MLGVEDPEALSSMHALATTLENEGHFADAEKLERETFDIRRRVLGPEHPATLDSMRTLAEALANEGQFGQAEKLQREALDIEHRLFGPEDLRTLSLMSFMAWTLEGERKLVEAESLERSALEIERHVLGPENPGILYALESEAGFLSLQGHYSSAENCFARRSRSRAKQRNPAYLPLLGTVLPAGQL